MSKPASTVTTVTKTDRTIAARHGELRVRDYEPGLQRPGTARIVWVHGGGFGSGSIEMPESDAVAVALAESGRPVTTVEYRLVPRFPLIGPFRMKPSPHRYPVPADDVTDAFDDASARRVGRRAGGRVVLGGASAGACLAASAALRLRDAGLPGPSGLLLAYGLFHARLPEISPTLHSRLRGIARLGIGPEMVRRMTLNYVGETGLHQDPATFPGTADLAGLPPALLVDADRDALRASGEAFATRLRAAGGQVEATVIPQSRHGFLDHPTQQHFADGIAVMTSWLDEQDRRAGTDPDHVQPAPQP